MRFQSPATQLLVQQIKQHQSSALLALSEGIPLTKGQWCGDRFHGHDVIMVMHWGANQ